MMNRFVGQTVTKAEDDFHEQLLVGKGDEYYYAYTFCGSDANPFSRSFD